MAEIEKLICVTCPRGCSLQVTHNGESIIKIEGNRCSKGLKYAESEIRDQRRTLTTTVRVKGGVHPLVPVYTQYPIPKRCIFVLRDRLNEVELVAPVKMGQVVMPNALGLGIDVVASRDLPEK